MEISQNDKAVAFYYKYFVLYSYDVQEKISIKIWCAIFVVQLINYVAEYELNWKLYTFYKWTQTSILGSKAASYSPGLKLTKFANNSELMTQTSIKLGNPCLCIKECYWKVLSNTTMIDSMKSTSMITHMHGRFFFF